MSCWFLCLGFIAESFQNIPNLFRVSSPHTCTHTPYIWYIYIYNSNDIKSRKCFNHLDDYLNCQWKNVKQATNRRELWGLFLFQATFSISLPSICPLDEYNGCKGCRVVGASSTCERSRERRRENWMRIQCNFGRTRFHSMLYWKKKKNPPITT